MHNPTEQELRNLRLLTALLEDDLTGITDIDLSYSQFGSASLGHHFVSIIVRVIDKAHALKRLDISANPLPPEIVLQLHFIIERMNSVRLQPVTLVSQYSLWRARQNIPPHVSEELIKTFWFLSEWESSEQPRDYLDLLTEIARTNPKEMKFFKKVFDKKRYSQNRGNLTLFEAIIKLPTFTLTSFLIEKMGPDSFTLQLEMHKKNYNLSEHTIYMIIVKGLLPLNRPDLAREMANEHLSNNSHYKTEAFAEIAYHEKDYAAAHDLYLEAIGKGSTTAHLALIGLVENIDEKVRLLEDAARKGSVPAIVTLVFYHEKMKNLFTSYRWLVQYHLALSRSSEAYLSISSENVQALQNRLNFYANTNHLIEAVIDKRAEVLKEQFKNSLPGYTTFKQEVAAKLLADKLLEPTWRYLVDEVGLSLLDLYLKKSFHFIQIEKHMTDSITVESQPNKKLLSMNPDEFAQACKDTITHYLTARIRLRPPEGNHRCLHMPHGPM